MLTESIPVYDHIGKTYDATRKADPAIVAELYQLLSHKTNGCYLDLACGSGNYTIALAAQGLKMTGIDISNEMLAKARAKSNAIEWFLGNAKQLPFEAQVFTGVTCILATHHMDELTKVFKEVYRVMKPGQFVIFTATPEQVQNYWLTHYFPNMITESVKAMKSFDELKILLEAAEFTNIVSKPFFITNNLVDWFLHAGKYRPEIYLDPAVRAGISSFPKFCHSSEEESGLKRLAEDIQSGKIDQVIKSFESNIGDYLFMAASKAC